LRACLQLCPRGNNLNIGFSLDGCPIVCPERSPQRYGTSPPSSPAAREDPPPRPLLPPVHKDHHATGTPQISCVPSASAESRSLTNLPAESSQPSHPPSLAP